MSEEESVYTGSYLRVTVKKSSQHTIEIERVYVRSGVSVILITGEGKIRCIREHDVVGNCTRTKLVSGWLEEGEDPLERAKLELQQELGFTADQWRFFHLADDEGAVVKQQHYFIARRLTEGVAAPEPGERIACFFDLTLDECRDSVLSGEFGSTATAFCLLKFLIEHERAS